MKRAGFTMIELIFVIVILGILAAVAIPKMSAVKDDAQLANANENFCANIKGPMLSYAVRHGGSLVGAQITDYLALPTGWTAKSSGVTTPGTFEAGKNLAPITGAMGANYVVSNASNNVYIYYVDGNDTTPFGCYVGNKATYTTTGTQARALRDAGSNYL